MSQFSRGLLLSFYSAKKMIIIFQLCPRSRQYSSRKQLVDRCLQNSYSRSSRVNELYPFKVWWIELCNNLAAVLALGSFIRKKCNDTVYVSQSISKILDKWDPCIFLRGV